MLNTPCSRKATDTFLASMFSSQALTLLSLPGIGRLAVHETYLTQTMVRFLMGSALGYCIIM